jgi:PleD family two-component response regulator
MTTTATTADQIDPSRAAALPSAAQKVVIVNGSAEMLGLIETALDAGHYDVVFVESTEHAYSQIKRVQPHLVILCVHIDDAEGLQVLSMLKLDAETRDIPVVTYTTEYDGEDVDDDDEFEPPETELFTPKPALWKN